MLGSPCSSWLTLILGANCSPLICPLSFHVCGNKLSFADELRAQWSTKDRVMSQRGMDFEC